MKLLFDENLSPKLPRLIESQFPGSVHVRDCGLKGRPDSDVWEYARANGFVTVRPKIMNPLENPKTANAVLTVRSKRGNWATKYDANVAI